MSMKTKIAVAAIAAITLAAGVTSNSQKAEAGYHGGVGVGIAAGALFGAAIAANAGGYPVYATDYGYRRCGFVNRYDAYGNYIGRVRTCAY